MQREKWNPALDDFDADNPNQRDFYDHDTVQASYNAAMS